MKIIKPILFATLTTLSLIPTITIAEDSYNSVLEYGIIDLDKYFDLSSTTAVNENLASKNSLLNYTYYFSPVNVSNQPYNLAAELGRNSWVKTRVINNLLGDVNLNGQYYLDNGYDVEYQLSYNDEFDSRGNETDIGVIVNFEISDKWRLGLGLQKHFEDRVYYVSNGSGSSRGLYKFQNETALLLRAEYLNLQNNIGWHIKTWFNYDPTNNSGRADVTAEYYSSIQRSTSLYLGFVHNNRITGNEEKSYIVSIAQKYWTSKYKSIDYGISWNMNKENDRWGRANQTNTNNVILFDLNGTWRF